ncbi:MAG: hypothetical protein ACRDKA_12140 [Actinomycetota bacterium]
MSVTTSTVGEAGPAAIVAATGFVLLAGFHVFLAAGVPWGRAAWGGAHDGLPSGLRTASGVAAVVMILSALIVLGRAGSWGSMIPFGVFRWGTWALVGGLALSALGNLASSSTWERFLMGPVALVLAGLCFVVARAAVP